MTELPHAEFVRLAAAAANGKRPNFFDSPETDRLMSILLAVIGELAVTRERLDTLERLLAGSQTINLKDIDGYRPDADAAQARGQWQIEYLSRVFRILQQEQELLSRGPAETSAEELSRELATK